MPAIAAKATLSASPCVASCFRGRAWRSPKYTTIRGWPASPTADCWLPYPDNTPLLVANCPFCLTLFEDAIKTGGLRGAVAGKGLGGGCGAAPGGAWKAGVGNSFRRIMPTAGRIRSGDNTSGKEEVMADAVVVKQPFGYFSFTVTLAIIVVVFCIMYLYVRRKKNGKQVDKQAGDEGED